MIVWALRQDAFTKNSLPLPVREDVATEFGLFLLATVLVLLGAGLAIDVPRGAPAAARIRAAAHGRGRRRGRRRRCRSCS